MVEQLTVVDPENRLEELAGRLSTTRRGERRVDRRRRALLRGQFPRGRNQFFGHAEIDRSDRSDRLASACVTAAAACCGYRS